VASSVVFFPPSYVIMLHEHICGCVHHSSEELVKAVTCIHAQLS